jgi:4-amino-4-deoxy-L-arabinose transferase-like glycosyltransferase
VYAVFFHFVVIRAPLVEANAPGCRYKNIRGSGILPPRSYPSHTSTHRGCTAPQRQAQLDPAIPETPLLSSILGFLITLVLLVGFYVVRKPEERSWLMPLALLAFLLKAFIMPFYFQWLVYIGDGGFAYADAGRVHRQAIQMGEEIVYETARITPGWAAVDPGFYQLTAYTYLIFGPNTLIIRFMLIMCISMSLLYTYRITRMYFDEPTARLAAGLHAFMPAPILLSLNHRKDPVVQLIVMFAFYHAMRVFRQDQGWQKSAFMVIVGLFAVYPFRSGLVLPFIGMMVICFVLANRNALQGIVLTLITLLSLVVLQLSIPEDSRVNLDTYASRATGKFAESAEFSNTGGLTRLLRVTGPLDIYKVPFAAVAYMFLPFPPNIDGYPVTILSSFLHLVAIFLLPHMMLGAWSLIRAPDWRLKLPLIVFPTVFLLVLGAVHIGLLRYREIFYPICMIWIAIGWRIGTPAALRLIVYVGLLILTIPIYLTRFGFL